MAVAAKATEAWTVQQKIEVSIPKTVYMLPKGNLYRDPMVHTNGQSISRSAQLKYLRVRIDSN